MNPVQVQIHQEWVKKMKQDTFNDQLAVEKCISLLKESKNGNVNCQDCSARCRSHLKMLGFVIGKTHGNRNYQVSIPSSSSSDR